MADHMRTELVADALRIAANNVTFVDDVTIFRSDRGVQHVSAEFAATADQLKVHRSVGRIGIC